MRFPFTSRLFGQAPEFPDSLPDPLPHEDPAAAQSEAPSSLLKTVAWISAGVGALALGLVVGREIRQRYKFTRRTPYDFYAHAGDERDLEFGVGI